MPYIKKAWMPWGLGNALFFFVVGNSFLWMRFSPPESGYFIDVVGIMAKSGALTAITTAMGSLSGGILQAGDMNSDRVYCAVKN